VYSNTDIIDERATKLLTKYPRLRLERPDDDLASISPKKECYPHESKFHHWVNSHIELRGMHRFKKDPMSGESV
jgi:hypothetical protein